MATIDTTFRTITAALRSQGTAAAAAVQNQVPFQNEIFNSGTAIDLKDLSTVRKYFDRSKLGQQYTDTLENPGPQNGLNVAIAAKLQSDFLAQCDRDFRMQHVSRVQSRCHFAARRLAHGNDAGPVAKGIAYEPLRYLQITPPSAP